MSIPIGDREYHAERIAEEARRILNVKDESYKSKLKPCPFCKGKVHTRRVHLRTNAAFFKKFRWTVECETEGCMAFYGCSFYRTEAEAIDAWNTRPERTCHNVAPAYLDFLCSECGYVHYHSDENDTGEGNDWGFCPNCGAKVVEE